MQLHFTPTYFSWINQAELWFAKIERDVIARGIFTSLRDPKRTLTRSIRKYNQSPGPVKWTYADPRYCMTPTSLVTVQESQVLAYLLCQGVVDFRVPRSPSGIGANTPLPEASESDISLIPSPVALLGER